jgi:hypothetical protein
MRKEFMGGRSIALTCSVAAIFFFASGVDSQAQLRGVFRGGGNSGGGSGFFNRNNGNNNNNRNNENNFSQPAPFMAPAPAAPVAPAPVAPPAPPRVESAPPVALVAPGRNQIPNQVTVADARTVRQVGAKLDGLLDERLTELKAGLRDKLLDDERRNALLAPLPGAEYDQKILSELRNATIDLDVEAAQRAAKKLAMPEANQEQLIPAIALDATLAALEKFISNSDSPEKVDTFARQMQAQLRNAGLPRAQRETVSEDVEKLLELLRVRLLLSEKPSAKPGQKIPVPAGELPVVYCPGLPVGSMVFVAESVLAVGRDAKEAVAVETADGASFLGGPKLAAKPLDEIPSESARLPFNRGTVLVNPTTSGAAMQYTVNGTRFSMPPGQLQHLPAGTKWSVSFDRGGGAMTSIDVGEGTYEFSLAGNRRELKSINCDVNLIVPAAAGAFKLTLDNSPSVLEGDNSYSVNGSYPMVIGFDPGDGKPLYKRLLPGDYAFAIAQNTGRWDLFRKSDLDPTVSPAAAILDTPPPPPPAIGAQSGFESLFK